MTTPASEPPPPAADSDNLDSYADATGGALVFAAEEGCDALVQAIAVQTAALSDVTNDWLERFAADDEAGNLDLTELQSATELLAQKFLTFEAFMDALVERGGGAARYAALVGDTAGSIGFTLLMFQGIGIDIGAGTYDVSMFDELGFAEDLAEFQFRGLDANDFSARSAYCD